MVFLVGLQHVVDLDLGELCVLDDHEHLEATKRLKLNGLLEEVLFPFAFYVYSSRLVLDKC